MRSVRFWLTFILLWSTQALADDWNTTDKVLFGAYVLGSTIDAIQTDQGLRSGKFQEENPILGSNPSTERIVLTKLAVGAGLYYLADHFPNERRAILFLANTIQWTVVGRNHAIGMEIRF